MQPNELRHAMYDLISMFVQPVHKFRRIGEKLLIPGISYKELVNAYYDRDDYPLQFCLDCDWEKALGVI